MWLLFELVMLLAWRKQYLESKAISVCIGVRQTVPDERLRHHFLPLLDGVIFLEGKTVVVKILSALPCSRSGGG